MPTLAQQIAAEQARGIITTVQGTGTAQDGTPIVVPPVVQLLFDLTTAKATILDLGTRLLTQQQISAGLAQLVHSIVGGETVAQSLLQLYQLIQANAAGDQTTAADLLSRITQLDTKATANASALLLTAKQSDLVALTATVGGKADAATLTTVKSTAEAVAAKVNDAATGLVATKLVADAATTSAATANTEVAKRVLRAGDTMSGPLNVQAPATSNQPLQLGQNPSGENRPFREFISAGTTPVVGTNPGTKATTISDAMSLGRAYSIRSLVVNMKEAATLGIATIASLYLVSPAGVVQATPFYQKTFASGLLTGLNKPVEGLGVGADKYPEIPTGYGVALSLSSGKCNANIDGILATPSTT